MTIMKLHNRLSALSSNELFAQLDPSQPSTRFDLTAVTEINAVGMLNLLLAIQWLRHHKQKVYVHLPKDPISLARLRAMHFLGHFHALGAVYPQVPQYPNLRDNLFGPRFPVIRIGNRKSPGEVAGNAYDHLRGLAGYPASEAEAVGNLMSELCGNLLEHSHSPGGGFAVMEVQSGAPRRPSTVIALGDIGIGLRQSLDPYYRSEGLAVPRQDVRIIREAVRAGVTSTGAPGRGGGLSSVRRLSRKNGYHLGIRSGNTLLLFAPNGREATYEGASFPGVQVYIALEHQVLTSNW